MNLVVDRVVKTYAQGDARLTILNELSLEVTSGEVVAIVGESGSGKSTLLSLLAGFVTPDRGHVRWDQNQTATWTEARWAQARRRDLGFVFQHFHLLPYLTANENVALPLRLLGTPDPETVAARALEQLGLGARANHLPAQLSGGESQRVAIARALVHSPGLLLADEPTGSLDHRTAEATLDLLFGLLGSRRQTALIVTHSDRVAERCHRVLKLRDGRLWST